MSSESDQDEFFDAEDSTPFQSFLAVPSQNSPTTSETLSDIEEEEKRILDLKRRAEQRRKKEDEDLERRLSLLRKKKAAEFEDTIEHVNEDELRRRKLLEMRQLIGNECTPVKTSETMVSVDESTDESSISEVFENGGKPTGTKSNTIEKMENNWADSDEYLLRLRRKRSGSFGDLPRDTSNLQDDSSVSEVIDEMDNNISQYIPEKSKLEKSLSFDKADNISCTSAEVVVDYIIKEEQIARNEPDIVQSTKTRTPPTSFIKPVAPPRRKRRSQEDNESIASASEFCNPGLPPATPASSAKHPSHDPEKSLDIDSAIGGMRHITSQEADAHAKHLELDTQSDDFPVYSLEEVTDDELLGGSDTESGRKKSCRPTMREKQKSLDEGKLPVELPVRPRSNSGRSLTDQEILDSVMILDLDTGDKIPLSVAEEKIPTALNPLALHIMKLTQEYQSDTQSMAPDLETDEEDTRSEKGTMGTSGLKAKEKAIKLKKFLGRKMGRTVKKVKNVADNVLHTEEQSIEKEVSFDGKIFKIKSSGNNKGPHDFTQLQMLQDMSGEHMGAIWTMKFSPCGRLLATGGQDSVLRIWVLKSAYSHFDDLRQKYSDVKVSPAPSHESLNSLNSETSFNVPGASARAEDSKAPFMKKPFFSYQGHSADLLDISWSKNYFILSSSMDKTVRLWHISRRECLCTFQHIDFVTAIVFHPKDDRYFLSGSLDGKLRLWNIPDKKVTLWSEVRGPSNLITTANFCQNGKFAVVGTYDGKCIFYNTEQLKYFTQIHVRSTRGKNAKGRKITGIEPLHKEDKLLVTSNDSRIRMYDLRDLTLSCKYKGSTNNSSQIKANLSPGEKYIVCGSEDHFIYIWKVHHDYTKFSSARRDRNDYWEAIKVHNAVVTAAIFVPNPSLFYKTDEKSEGGISSGEQETGEIIISADFTGAIKVIANKPKC